MPAPKRPRVPKASDILADKLRSHILVSELQPGDPMLSESELIERYRLSRGSVREALRLLESDGLIEIRRGPRGGIRVRHPELWHVSDRLALVLTTTATSLKEFLAFRGVVEPAAAAAAAAAATPEERDWLVELVEKEKADRHLQTAADFHVAIATASHNRMYSVMIPVLLQVLEWHLIGERLGLGDIEDTHTAHHAIATAIAKGDGNTAARRVAEHLATFEATLAARSQLDQPLLLATRWHNP